MKILMVAAEAAPYAQIGGLSQVVLFLTKALRSQGHDVRIFLPKYGSIDERRARLRYETKNLRIPTGEKPGHARRPDQLIVNLKVTTLHGIPTYFLENQEYYELRSQVYGYKDDAIRFFLLGRGVLEWLRSHEERDDWVPDLIHCHDWHTGYLVEELRQNPRYAPLARRLKVLFTIHNLKYQGAFTANTIPPRTRDRGGRPLRSFFDPALTFQNPLMRAISQADWVSTVSETYAREMQTPEHGEGLDPVIRRHRRKLVGILNGIDRTVFNPATDRELVAPYSLANLTPRRANKQALQRQFRLPVGSQIPLLAFVGRLVPQKGIDLLVATLPHLFEESACQMIFVGTGDETYHTEVQRLKRRFPDRIAAYLYRDFVLPRRIYAGSDLILIPSKFEPAGIVPMEAMRYGCVPLVSATGGLTESVTPFRLDTRSGNGFLFSKPDTWHLYAALVRALQVYRTPALWRRVVVNAMRTDFSWARAARHYDQLYQRILTARINTSANRVLDRS